MSYWNGIAREELAAGCSMPTVLKYLCISLSQHMHGYKTKQASMENSRQIRLRSQVWDVLQQRRVVQALERKHCFAAGHGVLKVSRVFQVDSPSPLIPPRSFSRGL